MKRVRGVTIILNMRDAYAYGSLNISDIYSTLILTPIGCDWMK